MLMIDSRRYLVHRLIAEASEILAELMAGGNSFSEMKVNYIGQGLDPPGERSNQSAQLPKRQPLGSSILGRILHDPADNGTSSFLVADVRIKDIARKSTERDFVSGIK
jgi:hypothetical protein